MARGKALFRGNHMGMGISKTECLIKVLNHYLNCPADRGRLCWRGSAVPGTGARAISRQGRDTFILLPLGKAQGSCAQSAARKKTLCWEIPAACSLKTMSRELLTLLSPKLSPSPYSQGSGRGRSILVQNQEESKQQ